MACWSSSGAILFSLGVIAEYLGVAVNMAMGKPLYLIVSDPANGPLRRRRPRPSRADWPGRSATALLGTRCAGPR